MPMRPDLSHRDQQVAFHAALRQSDPLGAPPAGLTAPDPAEVTRRFAVYRNNMRHSLGRALAAQFPVVEALVGAEFFAAMAQVFIARFPPRGPVLHEWGEMFPGFVARFPPAATLPWLGCVARLERTRLLASHDADAAPMPPDALGQALAQADLARLRVRLHPSVRMFASPHPALAIWKRHQPGTEATPLTAGPSHALIGRERDFTVIVAAIDAGTHGVLTDLAAGAPLGQAALHADPTTALTLLLRHGLITALQTGDTP